MREKSIYFYLGSNINKSSVDLIKSSESSILIYDKKGDKLTQEVIKNLEHGSRAHSISADKINSSQCNLDLPDGICRELIIEQVLNDKNLFLLKTRYMRFDFVGAFKAVNYFTDIVDYAIQLAQRSYPKLVFCGYTPHTVESLIIIKTFEAMGATVIRLSASPLPWILLPIKGLRNEAGCNYDLLLSKPCLTAIDGYLLSLRGSYADAVPYYEKQIKLYHVYNIVNLLRNFNLRKVYHSIEKFLVQLEYKKNISAIPQNLKYGVYFLHFQPEMNTVPEAGVFCDQYNAIRKLAAALPAGATLIVKEHPSTFTKRADRRWRPAGFYSRILKLPNVRLSDPKIGTFELIDRSQFVSSIAGVCLSEGLAREKPVVSFFSPRFLSCMTDIVIDANIISVSELKIKISEIFENKLKIKLPMVSLGLMKIAAAGYDCRINEDEYIINSDIQSGDFAKKATNLAIRDVLNNVLY